MSDAAVTTPTVETDPGHLDVCPVHNSLVIIAESGRFIRRCEGCVDEATQGLEILAAIRRRKRGV